MNAKKGADGRVVLTDKNALNYSKWARKYK